MPRRAFRSIGSDRKGPASVVVQQFRGGFSPQQNSDEEARKALQGALAKNSSYAPAMDNLKALDSRPPPQPLSIGSRESEPNDDVFHANIMKLNTGVSAAIEPASDVDTFQIESEGSPGIGSMFTFENRSNGLQPQMRILQLNKEELVPWNRAATAGADHSIAFVAAPNTKYSFKCHRCMANPPARMS